MSSASIYAEMMNCQNQINSLHVEIQQLEEKIDSQEYIHNSFTNIQEYYYQELLDKYNKKSNVDTHQSKVVLSQRFQEKTNDLMSSNKKNDLMGRLESISAKLKDETQQHIDKLEQLQQNLFDTKNRMSQLQIDYHNALAAEEAERRRAVERERLRQMQIQN